ncbi:hypothetical protein [Pleurocapsa sp. PCC 7319]|uniref:hypothetical protein n=1 Tax=Pleurocapsa sp. PCC 7319 TaxID=118161 RepID=UPI000345501E|nr:hypothetical protein [Pleurocapsa sp. PCC 7319]
MTLQTLFLFLLKHRAIVVGLIVIAPWLSWLICVAVPGRREEPFVLNFNLGLALVSLLGEIGYLLYATNTGGWSQVVQEGDILLLLAPLYYVGVSLWLARQRLPLSQLPVYRVAQGLGMIAVAYLLLSGILSKIRLIFFSFLPFGYFIILIASVFGLAYLGYLRIIGRETSSDKSGLKTTQSTTKNKQLHNNEVEDELERLRRKTRRRKKP